MGKEVEREREKRRKKVPENTVPSLPCRAVPPHQEHVWNFPTHPILLPLVPGGTGWEERWELGGSSLGGSGLGCWWPSSTLLEARLCICEVFPLICHVKLEKEHVSVLRAIWLESPSE